MSENSEDDNVPLDNNNEDSNSSDNNDDNNNDKPDVPLTQETTTKGFL